MTFRRIEVVLGYTMNLPRISIICFPVVASCWLAEEASKKLPAQHSYSMLSLLLHFIFFLLKRYRSSRQYCSAHIQLLVRSSEFVLLR